MKIEERIVKKKCEEEKQKCILVGIRIDKNDRLLLNWALVKVAKPGDRVVAVHVCRDSVEDSVSKEKTLLDGYLEVYKGLCIVKQLDLIGQIAHGSSVRKVLVREAKLCAAEAVVVGISRHSALVCWVSMAKYCAKRLPPTTTILAIHNGKIVFKKGSINQPNCGVLEVSEVEKLGPQLVNSSEDGTSDGVNDTKHDNFSFVHEYKEEISSSLISMPGWPLLKRPAQESLKEEVSSSPISGGDDTKNNNSNVVHEHSEEVSSSLISVIRKDLSDPVLGCPFLGKAVSATLETLKEEVSSNSISSGDETKSDNISIVHEYRDEVSSSPISVLIKNLQEPRLGWPLLKKGVLVIPETLNESEASEKSVVQWVMSLPKRNPPSSPQTKIDFGSREIIDCGNKSYKNFLSAWGLLPKELELLLRTNTSTCKWFSHKELKNATSQFSSKNLIGKGGSSRVYKGCLLDGKLVAVKILKLSKEPWRDFILEVDIISSLKHKHIIPLIGVCLDGNNLTLVYNFLSKGSLEENLHGKKGKYVMPWEVRYNVAVGVAEAINYLHDQCSRPVIHRDIKSSNILLSDEYEPQLSDFGLALWAPTSTSYETHSDVLGTFGYLAPEYFTYGRVSDKIDVYSFGVVLLELLSGRKPISTETPKGQESLVMWAKPMLDSGDIIGILDPNLVGKFDEVQIQRMVRAITLCITRKAQLRPQMCQILKLLQGEKDGKEWVNSHISDQEESDSEDGFEAYPESSVEIHLGLAMLDVDDDTMSISSVEQTHHHTLKDYLEERWSRSSSFN